MHSHRLTLARQIGYFCLGLFFAFLGLGFAGIGLSSEDPVSSFTILPALVPLTCLLTVGIMFIAVAIFNKVTISAQCIEYHTPLLIVSAKWQHLQIFERQESEKYSLIIVPTEGTVIMRPLTKIVPWLVRKDPRTFSIDTSQFGNSDGHGLAAEINAFVVNQNEP